MELIGKIVQVLPLQSGTSKAGNPWQKQEYILETLGTQYPRKVCFELFGDNVNKFPLQVGQEVTVSIDVESREFNGRWYTSVRAWNVVQGIQLPGVAAPAPAAYNAPQPSAPGAPVASGVPAPPAPAAPAAPAGSVGSVGSVGAADDLPF